MKYFRPQMRDGDDFEGFEEEDENTINNDIGRGTLNTDQNPSE